MFLGTSPVILLTLVASHRLVRKGKFLGPILLLLFVLLSGFYATLSSYSILAKPYSSERELMAMAVYLSMTAVPMGLGTVFGISTGFIDRVFVKRDKDGPLVGDNPTMS